MCVISYTYAPLRKQGTRTRGQNEVDLCNHVYGPIYKWVDTPGPALTNFNSFSMPNGWNICTDGHILHYFYSSAVLKSPPRFIF